MWRGSGVPDRPESRQRFHAAGSPGRAGGRPPCRGSPRPRTVVDSRSRFDERHLCERRARHPRAIHPGNSLAFGDVECAVVRGGAAPVKTIAVASAAAALAIAYALAAPPSPLEKPAAVVAESTYLSPSRAPRAAGHRHGLRRTPTLLATNAHVADTLRAFMIANPDSSGVALRSDSDERVQMVRTPSIRAGSVAALRMMPRYCVSSGGTGRAADARRSRYRDRTASRRTAGDLRIPYRRDRRCSSTRPADSRCPWATSAMGDISRSGLAIAPGMSGSPIFLAERRGGGIGRRRRFRGRAR